MWSGSRELDGAGRLSVKSGRVSTTGTVVVEKAVGGRSEQARRGVATWKLELEKAAAGERARGLVNGAHGAGKARYNSTIGPCWRIYTYVRWTGITKLL